MYTMEDFARGIVAGFAVSTAIPVMYYFNKTALGTLFAVNKEIGKALARVLLPPSPSPPITPNKKCPKAGGISLCKCYDCAGGDEKP